MIKYTKIFLDSDCREFQDELPDHTKTSEQIEDEPCTSHGSSNNYTDIKLPLGQYRHIRHSY